MFRALRTEDRRGFLIGSALVGVSVNMREFGVFYLWVIPLAARFYGATWRRALSGVALAVLASLGGFICGRSSSQRIICRRSQSGGR
jgi:hypothetical protein